MVTVEDDVFIGPQVVFTDDPHPMNCPRYRDCKGGAVVRRLARIGANATILPGVTIGENALVGAGAVVVDDVPRGPSSSVTRPASSSRSTTSPALPASSPGPSTGPRTRACDAVRPVVA